jgi:hypothetical protein
MHANKREEVSEFYSGEIGAVVGLKYTLTGDTLCDESRPIILERMEFPDPVISVAVEPKTKAGFDYDMLQDTLNANFIKVDSQQNSIFTLYGFILDKNEPGILYSPIGINGAATYSFLKCENFEKELSLLNPDLLILSLGTNDAYGKGYNDSIYYNNIDSLVSIARNINPNCEIILTVPNDDYYKRRYPNKNTVRQERTIKKIAKDKSLMVWDVFRFMGGLGSSQLWYKNGLMKYDRIHFTKQGYELKGDLFFAAFMKRFNEYLSREYKITLNGNLKKVF